MSETKQICNDAVEEDETELVVSKPSTSLLFLLINSLTNITHKYINTYWDWD
jgi:hypothetical protein